MFNINNILSQNAYENNETQQEELSDYIIESSINASIQIFDSYSKLLIANQNRFINNKKKIISLSYNKKSLINTDDGSFSDKNSNYIKLQLIKLKYSVLVLPIYEWITSNYEKILKTIQEVDNVYASKDIDFPDETITNQINSFSIVKSFESVYKIQNTIEISKDKNNRCKIYPSMFLKSFDKNFILLKNFNNMNKEIKKNSYSSDSDKKEYKQFFDNLTLVTEKLYDEIIDTIDNTKFMKYNLNTMNYIELTDRDLEVFSYYIDDLLFITKQYANYFLIVSSIILEDYGVKEKC